MVSFNQCLLFIRSVCIHLIMFCFVFVFFLLTSLGWNAGDVEIQVKSSTECKSGNENYYYHSNY